MFILDIHEYSCKISVFSFSFFVVLNAFVQTHASIVCHNGLAYAGEFVSLTYLVLVEGDVVHYEVYSYSFVEEYVPTP